MMQGDTLKSGASATAAGLMYLIQELGIEVPPPAVRSHIVSGARRTQVADGIVSEYYPQVYTPEGITGNLKFALRYEPVDLSVLYATFRALDRRRMEDWVRKEPTGIFARRAWYLYELLTGDTLDVSDVPPTGYVDVLDGKLHVTGPVKQIRRQRVNDNLLGDAKYCPLIRRTDELRRLITARLEAEAAAIVESCDPTILARAVSYLYTKETKSSFAIEGEAVGRERTERFVVALARAAQFDATDAEAYVRLQNAIVDRRYAAAGWRTTQNFVGQTMPDFSEQVHFVCPKPEDVADLMTHWMRMTERLHHPAVDAVCAAAAIAFGFVFNHPFEDGNGRIHRFLVHHVLARARFTPPGLLFPVSAVMLRDRAGYDRVLEGFSSAILPFTDYVLDEGGMTVRNDTAHLYRYWDATPFAEYLYSCVAETIRVDLKQEIGFLGVFDAAVRATMEVVDMPDRRASLLVRLILQNKGTLSKNKRAEFAELGDEEVAMIEAAIRRCNDEVRGAE